ncbi:MAG: glycosyltransferase [Proteobacteria bacterium]|nr:glycosyltransferase [Pseudomonadota bacterium]
MTSAGDSGPMAVPPLLEALTPSYNSAATLPDTITSAWETNRIPMLLVDDGSTDASADDAQRREGVRVVRQRNAGPSVARNRAILESQARFVLFLDSDDLLDAGYRDAFEAALAQHPDADVFVCGMQVVGDEGQPIASHAAASLQPTPFLSLLGGEAVPTNGIIVRREVLARCGLFRPGLHHAEDIDLWLRLAAVTDRWVRMDHCLAIYRLRGGSLSKNGAAMWRGIRQVVSTAARMPVGPASARRAAAHRALVNGASYVWANALWPALRVKARSSLGDALKDVARLPLRFWPMMFRDGLQGLSRRRQGAH